MDYLESSADFLNLKSSILHTENADIVSGNITVSELALTLAKQLHPFVMCGDQIITPLDLLMAAYDGEEK